MWAVDNAAYGPVELPALIEWVRDERVTAATWIYSEASGSWHKADHLPELQLIFKRRAAPATAVAHDNTALQINPGALRRVRIFAEFSDEQMACLGQYIEMRSVRQFSEVVKQGDPGDAMFLILDGEVRVRLMIGGRETLLTTLAAGEFFGKSRSSTTARARRTSSPTATRFCCGSASTGFGNWRRNTPNWRRRCCWRSVARSPRAFGRTTSGSVIPSRCRARATHRDADAFLLFGGGRLR